MSEQVVFGYGVAHKDTGIRLAYTGRKVYDSKSAASGALTKAKKAYEHHYKEHGYADPHDYIVVPLIAGILQ